MGMLWPILDSILGLILGSSVGPVLGIAFDTENHITQIASDVLLFHMVVV
jgi:hypothetical protein